MTICTFYKKTTNNAVCRQPSAQKEASKQKYMLKILNLKKGIISGRKYNKDPYPNPKKGIKGNFKEGYETVYWSI